eukprot:scaffold126596_cov17-Tisochrysis_lutea.AAC.1
MSVSRSSPTSLTAASSMPSVSPSHGNRGMLGPQWSEMVLLPTLSPFPSSLSSGTRVLLSRERAETPASSRSWPLVSAGSCGSWRLFRRAEAVAVKQGF